MTAKIRPLARQFSATNTTNFKNLLVSGCSFTYNNSENYVCSWPYYLRDLAGFGEVYDCSQSGAGSNHIFNSVINEIETNPAINNIDTLIIVMWSGLTRTDVIATEDITKNWHNMSNYKFNDQYATLSIFNDVDSSSLVDQLCRHYKKIVSPDAQIYESIIKIIALKMYLNSQGFKSIITSWKDPELELKDVNINSKIVQSAVSTLDSLEYLDSYATRKNLKESDGHPSPDGYLNWTRDHLIPCLESANYINRI